MKKSLKDLLIEVREYKRLSLVQLAKAKELKAKVISEANAIKEEMAPKQKSKFELYLEDVYAELPQRKNESGKSYQLRVLEKVLGELAYGFEGSPFEKWECFDELSNMAIVLESCLKNRQIIQEEYKKRSDGFLKAADASWIFNYSLQIVKIYREIMEEKMTEEKLKEEMNQFWNVVRLPRKIYKPSEFVKEAFSLQHVLDVKKQCEIFVANGGNLRDIQFNEEEEKRLIDFLNTAAKFGVVGFAQIGNKERLD